MPGYAMTDIFRKRLPVLCINSYAGSLVIAAHANYHEVIGSYEDAGYGLKIQRENFPALDFKAKQHEWPEQDLDRTIVIAHPPCAAFSTMNTTGAASARGLGAQKFACTVKVMSYALRLGCSALAIESVVPAMEGARDVHDEHAKKHGYHVFRVLQNAVTFGLPQWRPRFWVIFVRTDLLDQLIIDHTPSRPVILDDILEDVVQPGESYDPRLARQLGEQRDRYIADFGRDAYDLIRGGYGYGRVGQVLRRYLKDKGTLGKIPSVSVLAKEHAVYGSFDSNTLAVLDVRQPAPTLLANSRWSARGRVLTYLELQRVMGFPDSYRWPGKTINSQKAYLSRGVCPPVATWVLDTLDKNLQPARRRGYFRSGKLAKPAFALMPGGVADLRPNRKLWNELVNHRLTKEAPC